MTEEERRDESELAPEEVSEQRAEAVPDRAAMGVVDANVAIPLDPAIAADVLAGEPVMEGGAAAVAEVEDEERGEQT
jgi:hypothetical protein